MRGNRFYLYIFICYFWQINRAVIHRQLNLNILENMLTETRLKESDDILKAVGQEKEQKFKSELVKDTQTEWEGEEF